MSTTAAPSIRDLAAATPDTRDRYVDFLRAISIAVVVFGHWLVAIIYFDGGRLTGESALDAVPAARIATWVLQVMPLFFFVGGFSNLTSWRATERRGGTYADFMQGRLARLMRPTLVFIGTWLLASLCLELFSPSTADLLQPGLAIIAKPLWFIAVYLIVIALAPVMLRLHERHRIKVPVVMALCAIGVDIARITFDVGLIGYLNFAFVWLFAHQLGFFYGDGTLAKLDVKRFVMWMVGGLAALTVLTTVGPYSMSVVGVDDGRISNNDPPSVCIIAHSMWLIGAAMSVRGPLTRRLQDQRLWSIVIAANATIMTVFLWHLTALLAAVLVLFPLGFPQPEGGTAMWWLLRPVWLAAATAFTIPFVMVLGRFERPKARVAHATGSRLRTAVGVGALVAGIAGFATSGFSNLLAMSGPLTHAAAVGTGLVLLDAKGRRDG